MRGAVAIAAASCGQGAICHMNDTATVNRARGARGLGHAPPECAYPDDWRAPMRRACAALTAGRLALVRIS
jgi:hypothetical protein